MTQRPPDKDDATSEEQALEYDGTTTERLDDTYRVRVVTASENENGTVSFDDRGRPRWKWVTELDGKTSDVTSTFNHLKALDNPALGLEGDATPAPQPPSKTGYDPYATTIVIEKPKTRR